MKPERKRCKVCGRLIELNALGTDLQGRRVLAWHYTPTKKECPGGLRAAYLPGELKR